MTNEKILETFLKHHRKYSSFKRQKDLFGPNGTNYDIPIKDAILYYIDWHNTDESLDFWSSLHKKWKKMCKEMNITGTINLEDF